MSFCDIKRSAHIPAFQALSLASPSVITATVTIRRENGLGLSIAGGRGSPPYRGDDEVLFNNFIQCFSSRGSANVVVMFQSAVM